MTDKLKSAESKASAFDDYKDSAKYKMAQQQAILNQPVNKRASSAPGLRQYNETKFFIDSAALSPFAIKTYSDAQRIFQALGIALEKEKHQRLNHGNPVQCIIVPPYTAVKNEEGIISFQQSVCHDNNKNFWYANNLSAPLNERKSFEYVNMTAIESAKRIILEINKYCALLINVCDKCKSDTRFIDTLKIRIKAFNLECYSSQTRFIWNAVRFTNQELKSHKIRILAITNGETLAFTHNKRLLSADITNKLHEEYNLFKKRFRDIWDPLLYIVQILNVHQKNLVNIDDLVDFHTDNLGLPTMQDILNSDDKSA